MTQDWLDLAGRSAVVTGAGGGIGQQIAESLAAVGVQVALLDRNVGGCEEAADRIRAKGGSAVVLACDVTDPSSIEAARVAASKAIGPCDILVNNAALVRPGAMATLKLKDWNDLINVNLTGYFLCSQIFGKEMIERRRGSLIHVGSLAGSEPQPFIGAYSVSKAGVQMLSRTLAVEWGEFGIRSNVVSPAMIRTPLSEPIYKDPDTLARRCAIAPLRRIGTMGDIADAILFLASDRASYMTGQDLDVDGGVHQALMTLIPRPGFEKSNTA